MMNIDHFICDLWHQWHTHTTHLEGVQKPDADPMHHCHCRPRYSDCALLFVWDVFIDISILHHWLQVLFSVSSIFRVASIYSDIPLAWIVQFFASHLEGLMSYLLSREHTAMFLPLQTPSTRPTEIGSQQGSWFIGHFTRKAGGCSTACPTILNLSCQVWRYRSSVSVKAYLHCTVKLSVVTTACLLTFTPKHNFVCMVLWFRLNRALFFGRVLKFFFMHI